MSTLQALLLLEIMLHLVAALFTVETAQSVYVAHYGSTVNMTCMFPVAGGINMKDLKVYWHHKSSSQAMEKEIYLLDGGKENLNMQDAGYRGRATLLKDELYRGHAVLQIANVKLTDAGTYVCLIIYGGADHEQVTLQVKAPYTRINTWTEGALFSTTRNVSLSCQSEGFPLPEVFWLNHGINSSLPPHTSHSMTADGLYNVTSRLPIGPSSHQNYSCVFWNAELNERTSAEFFLLAEEEPSDVQRSLLLLTISTCIVPIVLFSAICFVKRKSLLRVCTGKKMNQETVNDVFLTKEENWQLNPPT
ncbi:programmed cell death 1 ligand 2 isoform X2 [Rhinatrema bivittatum]|uniref:programmed cell death 1 ligand 2 isoform X2 n=1 Tax=Rhinatrema bivittatum TaxID=194408 RepID=UPI00112DC35B|nr:programmed cell death 1 ligand 2 isoform X2 [Rhinatrema bivittatum]